jgi:hypothetical protein
MPELAKRVVLDLKQRKLFIDGTQFPWLIVEDGVHIEAGVDELCKATVTFFADAVEVIPRESQESAEKPLVNQEGVR